MVQLDVIFRRLGLCFSSSSSRLVGSHVENFSPTPKRVEGAVSYTLVVSTNQHGGSTGFIRFKGGQRRVLLRPCSRQWKELLSESVP